MCIDDNRGLAVVVALLAASCGAGFVPPSPETPPDEDPGQPDIETPNFEHYGFGWTTAPLKSGACMMWHNGSNDRELHTPQQNRL